jgi:hypothetical protein
MISRVSTVAIVMLFMAFAFLQRSFHPHVAALTEVAGDPFRSRVSRFHDMRHIQGEIPSRTGLDRGAGRHPHSDPLRLAAEVVAMTFRKHVVATLVLTGVGVRRIARGYRCM